MIGPEEIEEMNRKHHELKIRNIEFHHQMAIDRIKQQIFCTQLYLAMQQVFVVERAPIPGSIVA